MFSVFKFFFIFLLFWTFFCQAQTLPRDSVYELRTGRELTLLAVGGTLKGTAYWLNKNSSALTQSQITGLDANNMNSFDRGATKNWSPEAGRISDWTLFSTAGVVGLAALPTLRQKKWFTVPLMYVETIGLMWGLQDVVKQTALRTRPFVYNVAAPMSDKLEKDARLSFFSGHAAISFSSAVFASTVFGHYFPVSRWRPVVWVGSLALAGTTAYLRYEAGKHYPTDILVGAAVGSAVGWLVPKLHQRRPPRQALTNWRWAASPWTNGMTGGLQVQIQPN
jgi:membrane-associated phospholipid phosphatase